jgi:hypothetical protein
VTLDEQTRYPFGDSVKFEIHTSRPATFPLVLRVPRWCESASARVNGILQSGFDTTGFATIWREWRDGDVVDLDLPVRVQAREGQRGSISIQRGPLTFALHVGERWQKLPARAPSTEPFADWEVYPTTPWNYALVIDPQAPEDGLRLTTDRIAPRPFSAENPPLRLAAQARLVPGWTMAGLSAGPTPPSPVAVDTPIEDVTLVPYGCARLRVTELPYTTD